MRSLTNLIGSSVEGGMDVVVAVDRRRESDEVESARVD